VLLLSGVGIATYQRALRRHRISTINFATDWAGRVWITGVLKLKAVELGVNTVQCRSCIAYQRKMNFLLSTWELKVKTAVNLDALIHRADFYVPDSNSGSGGEGGKPTATATDLTKGEMFYSTLRKPDFQRETTAWSPQAICDLVKAFVDGELIPSIICWQSAARLSFVIDGAHRLSAIMAWLQDDYGDRDQSVAFYNNKIPPEQRRIAQITRDLIAKEVGAFNDYRAESQNPGSNPALTAKARSLAQSYLSLLWVKGNDPAKAERAFFTINQAAVNIDATELLILNSRFKPNAITARAIARNATGHKYWKDFSGAAVSEIESLGEEIYQMLFSPPLQPGSFTDDLPVAGHGYGTPSLPLLFDFVNIGNDELVVDASKAKKTQKLVLPHDAPDEQKTVTSIKNSWNLAKRITGKKPDSLGLHPAIYFYSSNGRHQPTAVLAIAALIRDLEKSDGIIEFTRHRARFENFLLNHKSFINQLTVKTGSMSKGFKTVKDYFKAVLQSVIEGKSDVDIEGFLKGHARFQFLVIDKPIKSEQVKDFTPKAKNVKFLSDALEKAFHCSICHSRLDKKSMNMDHTNDQKHGGLGNLDNSAWSHYYCNSAKDAIVAAGGALAVLVVE
jgi:hypothetical protein